MGVRKNHLVPPLHPSRQSLRLETEGRGDLYAIQNVRRKFSDFAYKNLIILGEGFKDSISLSSSSENVNMGAILQSAKVLKFLHKLQC